MPQQFSPDVEALIRQQMASGNFESPDQLFRVALEQLAVVDEDARSIQESIDLLDAGDAGVPLEEAFRRLREKHNVAADA